MPVSQMHTLRGRLDTINLGDSPRAAGWNADQHLRLSVPRDLEPTLTEEDLFAELLPGWYEGRVLSDAEALGKIRYSASAGPPMAGLFWGSGFTVRAVQLAVVTLYSFAPLIDQIALAGPGCGLSSGLLRAYMQTPGGLGGLQIAIGLDGARGGLCPQADYELAVGSDGMSLFSRQAHCQDPSACSGAAAFFNNSTVHFCDWSATYFGAATDYYLWWAARLLQHHRKCGSPHHYELAVLCAKVALAQIVELATILLHEVLHDGEFFVGGDHCKTGGRGKNYCTYVIQFVLTSLLMSEFSLPLANWTDQTRRFATPDTLQWHIGKAADGAAPMWVVARHCDWLEERHGSETSWFIPSACRSASVRADRDLYAGSVIAYGGPSACPNLLRQPVQLYLRGDLLD